MPAAPGTTSAARSVRPLTTDNLAELVEVAPSRRLMERPRPRTDFLEELSRTYDVMLELGKYRGSRYLTSWAELCALCDRGEGDRPIVSLQRYTSLLQEVGLIWIGPAYAGNSWGLVVRLLSDGRPCSSTGDAAGIVARFARQMRRVAGHPGDRYVGSFEGGQA